MMQVSASGRSFVKTRYFFKAGELPQNYSQVACHALAPALPCPALPCPALPCPAVM